MGLYKYKNGFVSSARQPQFIEGDNEYLFKLRSGATAHMAGIDNINSLVAQICNIHNLPVVKIKRKQDTRVVKIEQPAAGYEVLLSEQQIIAIGWFIEAFLTTNIGERYVPLRGKSAGDYILRILFNDVAGNILASGINKTPKMQQARADLIEIAKTLGMSSMVLQDGLQIVTAHGEIIDIEDYANTVGIGLESNDLPDSLCDDREEA